MKQLKFIFLIIYFFVINPGVTIKAQELELKRVDLATFEDEATYKNYLDESQKSFEQYKLQKNQWELEQQKLIDEGKKEEAKKIQDKINSTDSYYNNLKNTLTVETRQEWLDPQDETIINQINDSIESYNSGIQDTENLIENIKEEAAQTTEGLKLAKHEIEKASQQQPQDKTENELRTIISDSKAVLETAWNNLIEAQTEEERVAGFAEYTSESNNLQRTILAQLEIMVPIKKPEDYQVHKSILENTIKEIDNFDPTQLQNRLDEIDFFENTNPPTPQTSFEINLDLSSKIPSDQMKAIEKELNTALENNNRNTLNDITTAMQHYGLDKSYSNAYEFAQQKIDLIGKEQAPPPEVTQEEQQSQSWWQTVSDGYQSVYDAVWQTSEYIIEGTSEAFKTVAEAGVGFLKFTAIDASSGLAHVTSQAADFAQEHFDNMAKTGEILEKADTPLKIIKAILTFIPDYAFEKGVEAGAPKGAEELEKIVEEKLGGLQKETYNIVTAWLGEGAATLVDGKLNDLGNYLKQQGADQKVIDFAESFIRYTAEYIQQNPSKLATAAKGTKLAAQFFKSRAEAGQKVVNLLRTTEKLTYRLKEFAQEQLERDVTTARNLISAEEASFKPVESTFFGKLKTKVSSWLNEVKTTIKSIFDNSEQKLSSAKANYTSARNALMKFLEVDSTTATEQIISEKIKAANTRVTNQKDTPYYKLYEQKINDFLAAQDELAKVYADHKDELNSVATSLELTVKAWNEAMWPASEAKALIQQRDFAKDVIRLFDLRDAQIAHQSALQEGIKIIQDEVAAQKGSDFDPVNEQFIDNVASMLNNELTSTINTYKQMYTEVDKELNTLQTTLRENLGKLADPSS